jgi:hypothetical protein
LQNKLHTPLFLAQALDLISLITFIKAYGQEATRRGYPHFQEHTPLCGKNNV